MRFKAALFHFVVIALTALAPRLAAAEPLRLVGLGDSLMAGYQLPADESYTAQLEKALKDKGFDVVIENAAVSGDTTSGGLARADWSVPDGTDGVILELGANDALRGIAPEDSERNLDAMLARFQERGIAVMLIGMLAPPNMGDDYAARFNPIYPRLAEKYGVPLYPFFLDGVVTESRLKLEDGMHPNGEGVAVMVSRSLPVAEKFLSNISQSRK
ncbi:arylesterase [Rhizobiaceae bacterium BDR2-2]|uniref:Arylesterase n=1 Tax=Ectorhizobium quercum TaxID=2965071 RepID=A0AAE3N453_9HYPH|nr:arylesterase [Ectorhizobium quercum]MCX8999329.1 arylesterase [Ectorhizobium quercum]